VRKHTLQSFLYAPVDRRSRTWYDTVNLNLGVEKNNVIVLADRNEIKHQSDYFACFIRYMQESYVIRITQLKYPDLVH